MFGSRFILVACIAIAGSVPSHTLPAAGRGLVSSRSGESTPKVIAPDIDSGAWKPLVTTDLSGWTARNGTATFEFEDDQIVGRSVVGSPTSLLCTEKEFADFELTFEILLDTQLNSGVLVRSASKKEIDNGSVFGPQIEIEAVSETSDNRCESGYIFSEGTGRGWLSQNRIVNDTFANGQWNRFVIRVVGQRIQTWVNGRKIEDLLDEHSPAAGFIALQIHSVPNGTEPLEARWRDLRIRELPSGG